jgi:uncharacterized protein
MTLPSQSTSIAALRTRALIWRRIFDNGSTEFATVSQVADGFVLTGNIVAVQEGEPLEVKYRIECHADWRTRLVSVEQHRGLRHTVLAISPDDQAKWSAHGVGTIDFLNGCLDVDLELTPITNTLPVNRLKLDVGQRAEIAAAWIRFPSLEIVRANQSYERLTPNTYRYRSLASGFTAVIEVDEDGLPIRYQGIWERIGESAI